MLSLIKAGPRDWYKEVNSLDPWLHEVNNAALEGREPERTKNRRLAVATLPRTIGNCARGAIPAK